jgi:uncharacterized protein YbaP (TraB family)
MRRTVLGLATAAVAASLSIAPVVHGAPARPPGEYPALWRVATERATVHLFGSVHLATRDVYPLDPAIRQAFRAADTVVFEIPLDPESEARAAQLLLQAAQAGPGEAPATRLDMETRAKMRAALRTLGLPANSMNAVRPWFAALTLTVARMQMLGYLPEFGIERHFLDRAGHKRVGALETLEQQVAVFRDLPDDTQVEMLRQTLRDFDSLEQMLTDLFAAWRRGDARAVDALALAPMRRDYPGLYEAVITRRNRHMTDRIADMLARDGNVFVVVGVGHLVGPDSIVQLLRKRGFTVTRA